VTIQGLDFEGRVSNWPQVARLGYRFAVSRCIGENGALDPDFAPNLKGAAAAGLVPGGYHFIAGGGTVRDHARRFIDALGDPRGKLVQLDVEKPNFHPNPTIDDVAAWFDVWRSASAAHRAHPVLLYTGSWYWNGAGYPIRNANGAKFTPYLWHSGGAGYRTATRYPGDGATTWSVSYGGWSAPTLWQYRGSINIGVGASVDLNALRGDLATLHRLAGIVTPPPAPPQEDVMDLYSTPGRTAASVAAGTPYYDAPNGKQVGTITDAAARFDVVAQDKATSPAWVLIDGASADPAKYPDGRLMRWVHASALRNVAPLRP
jgi:GH25 family lysozyme M1 (1,4-beta-N-acetylmuramidase)